MSLGENVALLLNLSDLGLVGHLRLSIGVVDVAGRMLRRDCIHLPTVTFEKCLLDRECRAIVVEPRLAKLRHKVLIQIDVLFFGRDVVLLRPDRSVDLVFDELHREILSMTDGRTESAKAGSQNREDRSSRADIFEIFVRVDLGLVKILNQRLSFSHLRIDLELVLRARDGCRVCLVLQVDISEVLRCLLFLCLADRALPLRFKNVGLVGHRPIFGFGDLLGKMHARCRSGRGFQSGG